ncbi:MAG: glycosyltransferase [Opitutales bacterium]
MLAVQLLFWTIYAALSAALLVYGLNHYVLIALFLRQYRKRQASTQLAPEEPASWPAVVTQLPLYNEANVAERVIRAAAAMDYPGEHTVQVLDDSDDETRAIVDRTAAELRASGRRVDVVRRPHRQGFKAGALNAGLSKTEAPLIAIFDSDFVPPPDFLRNMVPTLLADLKACLAQARWGHLNAGESWITRALSVGVDGHFLVEQPARAWNGLYLNFNGTAGVWRRAAIEAAGGWQDDTLTEDMDLSYRAQLAGWTIHYRRDVVAPAELPSTFAALKSQQFRWAKGSMQTARKLLPRVLAAPGGWFRKSQSGFHLTNYCIHFAMAAIALLLVPVVLLPPLPAVPWMWSLLAAPILFAALAPSLLYLTGQLTTPGGDWRRCLRNLPGMFVLGFGLSLSNARAVLEAFSSRRTPFVRTPKRGTENRRRYRVPRCAWSWLEVACAGYCLLGLIVALSGDRAGLTPFLALYGVGFAVVGIGTLTERS